MKSRKAGDVELANNSCTCATCYFRYAPWRDYNKYGISVPYESKLNMTCVMHEFNVRPSDKACKEYKNDGIPF